jgi:hypothetical protein
MILSYSKSPITKVSHEGTTLISVLKEHFDSINETRLKLIVMFIISL